MSKRPEKIAILEEVRARMAESTFVILTDCRGMTVQGMTDLRQKLRGTRSRLQVVQNSFVRLVSKDTGWADVDQLLDGPTAMITGPGDISQVAKVLKDFVKATSLPRVKGGRFGTQTLTATEVDEMANLPSIEVLRQRVVGTIAAPMARLVGALQQKTASVLYVLKAVEEKKSKAGA